MVRKYRKTMKNPLTKEEIEKVLETAKKMGSYDNVDLYKLICAFIYTGMHPSVLADRETSRIRVIGEHLEWVRPKKHGVIGITRVLISNHIKSWIEEFIHSDLPRYREWYWYACKKVGKVAGIPELSPMSLRHTFGCILDDMGLTASEIQSKMNCSLPTLMRYTKRQEKVTDEKMKKARW